jgi:hypothetical protein
MLLQIKILTGATRVEKMEVEMAWKRQFNNHLGLTDEPAL